MSLYDDIREAAEGYINFDLPIIPLCSHNHRGCSDNHKDRCRTPGKAPVLKNWSQHKETSDEDIEKWFSINKYMNIGMVLGQTEFWNIVGVDIDGALGETEWQALIQLNDAPRTWEFKTGGGRRLLYMLPEGLKTKKNKVNFKEGHEELAFIAQGQQTVLPPSVHPSGAIYTWIVSPFECDIAMAPQWIIDKVQVDRVTRQGAEELPSFYGEEQSTPVVREECEKTVYAGNRSDAMARFVGSLCAKRNLPKNTILATAMTHNSLYYNPPLEQSEIEAMIDSIWEVEQKKHQELLAKQRKRQELHPAALTEMFITRQLNNGIHYKFFQERGRLYSTNKEVGPWAMISEEEVKADIHAFLCLQDGSLATTAKCDEVYKQILIDCTKQYGTGVELDLGRRPILDSICTQNGVLLWGDRKLVPWSKDFSHTVKIEAAWQENADKTEAYEVWNEALHTWIDQEETIMFLQEYIGYALLPTCKMRTAVFLHGEGANGKSLFIDIVQLLFENSYHVTQPKALASRFGTTAIIDKLLLVCSDIDSSYLDSTGTLKQIMAGDEIRAEYKGGKEFNIKPIGKMLFSANKLPKSGDKSHGWYSRLQLVHFPHQFKPDQRYYDKLMRTMSSPEGRSALLHWAVEGLARLWRNDSFTISTDMTKAKSDYKKDNDNVLAFAADILEPVEGGTGNYESSLIAKYMYLTYREWCEDMGMKPASQAEFVARLGQSGYYKKAMKVKIQGRWKSQLCIMNCQFIEDAEFEARSTYNSYVATANL